MKMIDSMFCCFVPNKETLGKHLLHLSLLFDTLSLKSLKVPIVTRREQQGTDDATLEAEAAAAPKRRSAPKAKSKAKANKETVMKRPSAKKVVKTVEKPKDEKIDKGKKQDVVETPETKPKKVKGDDKGKGGNRDKKRKGEPSESETQKTKPDKKAKTEAGKNKQGHQSRTWAGRWIPTDGPGLERFNAIRTTFTEHISHKVKAPSSLQNAFFTLCNVAFSTLSNNAEKKEFEACAKLQVEKFLATELVRT